MNNKELEGIKKLLTRMGNEVVNEAKTVAPRRTGNLKRDIQVFKDSVDSLEVEIGNTLLAKYAIYVHEGTGLYGKHKKRITPKNKKALKTPFGVFKSVAGQKAQPYLSDALNNYQRDGGLDRTLRDAKADINEEILDNIKESLKHVLI